MVRPLLGEAFIAFRVRDVDEEIAPGFAEPHSGSRRGPAVPIEELAVIHDLRLSGHLVENTLDDDPRMWENLGPIVHRDEFLAELDAEVLHTLRRSAARLLQVSGEVAEERVAIARLL